MKKLFIVLLITCAGLFAQAQKSEIGGMVGASFYLGDINPTSLFANSQVCGGLIYRYNFSPRWALKSNILFAQVQASDYENNNQYARNHAVQYFSFPDYKFQTLRDIFPAGTYEGSAPVALNEWITMRLEINGDMAEMFINDLKYSSFVVDKMLGKNKKGGIGLYVDIGTTGYFRDLKVTKKALKTNVNSGIKVSDI